MTTILCRIHGVRVCKDISIPIDSCQDIENAISAIKLLLNEFGEYELDQVPLFGDDSMQLSVAHHDSRPFDPTKFDIYARNVAEYNDSKSQGRDPLLNNDENGVAIERTCRTLKRFGKVVFNVNGMPDIELSGCKWKSRERDQYVTMDVESTMDVTALKCSSTEIIVSDAQADAFHPGASIRLDDLTPIHRVIGSLVGVVDDMQSATADMFSLADDDD